MISDLGISNAQKYRLSNSVSLKWMCEQLGLILHPSISTVSAPPSPLHSTYDLDWSPPAFMDGSCATCAQCDQQMHWECTLTYIRNTFANCIVCVTTPLVEPSASWNNLGVSRTSFICKLEIWTIVINFRNNCTMWVTLSLCPEAASPDRTDN